MQPKRFAVIGNPIDHSLSPRIHHAFAEKARVALTYEKILGSILTFESQVHDFFQAGGAGLNVTLPFKRRAFDMANSASKRAEKAKSANVLLYKEGNLYADNTDGIGLIRDLEEHIAFSLKGKKVVILGAGGAASGIINPLLTAQVSMLTVLNRDKEKRRDLSLNFPEAHFLSLEEDSLTPPYDLIIHATSAGMKDEAPLELPSNIWQGEPLCYDLSYATGKESTPFVRLAKRQGLMAYDGIGMLIEQAREAFVIWHGVDRSQISAESCEIGSIDAREIA